MRASVLMGLLVALLIGGRLYGAQAGPRAEAMAGVYEAIPDGQMLQGGLHNTGTPANAKGRIPSTSGAPDEPAVEDPYNLCQAIGPFRMMALERVRFELVPADGRIVMLFEDLSHGYLRSLYFNRPHAAELKPKYAWQGDSVAQWTGDSLTVDTRGFDDRTWLNERLRASTALHLTERLRLVLGGRYLEYRITAKDPGALASPYSYVRYYERIDSDIREDACEIHSNWTPDAGQ